LEDPSIYCHNPPIGHRKWHALKQQSTIPKHIRSKVANYYPTHTMITPETSPIHRDHLEFSEQISSLNKYCPFLLEKKMPSHITISRIQKFTKKKSNLTDTNGDIQLPSAESNVRRLNIENIESDEEDSLLRIINF